ncbi:MAG: DUF1638 domain-containing protein, partial [Candidatus Adiutrix sp.]
MNTHIIACAMIKDEIKKVLELSGQNCSHVFLKPNLDDKPEELRSALKEEMAKLGEPSRVLLGYGFSNGTLINFPAGMHTVVAPQAEDVLCLILGSQKRRDEILKASPSYLITEGWLRGDNIFSVFKHSVEKYGAEKAARLHKAMMQHYQRFLLVDTGVYDLDKYRGPLAELGQILGLTVSEDKGDLSWL